MNNQETISEIYLTMYLNLDTLLINRATLEKLLTKEKNKDLEAAIKKLYSVEFLLREVSSILYAQL